MLGDKLLQGKIALSLPHTCVEEMFLSLDFRHPFVLSSIPLIQCRAVRVSFLLANSIFLPRTQFFRLYILPILCHDMH